jgi:hypothetical protein
MLSAIEQSVQFDDGRQRGKADNDAAFMHRMTSHEDAAAKVGESDPGFSEQCRARVRLPQSSARGAGHQLGTNRALQPINRARHPRRADAENPRGGTDPAFVYHRKQDS